jgi:hypothetical protein
VQEIESAPKDAVSRARAFMAGIRDAMDRDVKKGRPA